MFDYCNVRTLCDTIVAFINDSKPELVDMAKFWEEKAWILVDNVWLLYL